MKPMSNLKISFQKIAAKYIIRYVIKDPDKNFPRLINFASHFALDYTQRDILDGLSRDREINQTYQFFRRILKEVRPNCVKAFVNNLGFNALLTGATKAQKLMKKEHFNIPYAILMDPTSACNLKCIGCWAAEYNKTDNLSIEVLDRIIREGKELGIYWYLYSGGEPLIRKKDLITLARNHPDCYFISFTNGILVDDAFAKELADVGNFTLAISVEGFEDSTDFRRGDGTYKAILKAMRILKENKVMFGFSSCYHQKNIDVMGSEEYYDFMIEQGAVFGWLFTYIPLGKNADINLMTTPDQRKQMFETIRRLRKTKPLFLIDFWNDGDFARGCIAGGRSYFHINAAGDVEPCAFIHYSTVNIKDVSVKQALQNKLFRLYQTLQPFNRNYLQPCPLLDNPNKLKEMVHLSGAKSTQPIDRESVDDLTEKCMDISNRWAPIANHLYKTSPTISPKAKHPPPRFWDEYWYTSIDNPDYHPKSEQKILKKKQSPKKEKNGSKIEAI
jgi:MoaA/NifB/PqqE/SkfB family radical SAM enzyme